MAFCRCLTNCEHLDERMFPVTSFRIIVRAGQQWSAHRGSAMGAALAYYALFSLGPLLVIAVTMVGWLFGEDAAQGQVAHHLRDLVGQESAVAIQNIVDSAAQTTGTWAGTLGIVLLVLTALGMFLHIRSTLCLIWNLEPPKGSSLLGIVLDYVLSLVMVFMCGVLLLASLVASMLLNIFLPTLMDWLPGLPWRWVELGLSFLYLTLLFAAMYHILSAARISWRYVLYGSFLTAVLFSIGKTLLGLYLVNTTTASAFGAASSLVVFLMWVYYSSQILFFGAELIQARRTRYDWLKPAEGGPTLPS